MHPNSPSSQRGKWLFVVFVSKSPTLASRGKNDSEFAHALSAPQTRFKPRPPRWWLAYGLLGPTERDWRRDWRELVTELKKPNLKSKIVAKPDCFSSPILYF